VVNPEPETFTEVPTGPFRGLLVIISCGVTVKEFVDAIVPSVLSCAVTE